MHNFDIIVKDDSFLMISIIFSSYIFAKAFFKPGDKVKKGIKKASTVTSEKELIAKYDDSFEKSIRCMRGERIWDVEDMQYLI